MKRSPAFDILHDLLQRRILVFDGAMGTMIQGFGLTEADFRGERFADHPSDLQGNNDLLSLTRPDVIADIHCQFLDAGADILETNTFSAQAISQADYGLEHLAYELNVASARIARRVADEVTAETPERPRFVAGSIGPTNRTLSISPRVEDPTYRAMTFDELELAYYDQARGLLDGGVDLLLPETTFDTLNLKAAIVALERLFEERGERVPVILSLTITDKSGRTLSGQTLDAAWVSIAHARPLAVGLNCALGATEMRPHVEELSEIADCYVHCYPNAGLPNAFGEYDEAPETMAGILTELADAGFLNLAGGCCGTRPEHIRAIAEAMAGRPPRRVPEPRPHARFAGLETLTLRPDSNLTMIGERTNVTGSRRFARRIKKDDWESALEIALEQVRGGANVLDVNMDEGMLDSVASMTTFLNLIATEPEVAQLPIMVDSSRFEVLEAGMKCLQGKSIANSISLKEGEDAFRRQAGILHRYGAGVVVMAFDEEGQAVDADHKVEICRRAFRILVDEVGFAPNDIVFDPNVLAVATGIEEHRSYARAFLDAIPRIKEACPGARVSGGVSNLSFSFRGNEHVREAMNAAFLYHAVSAGLDMAIVNAGQLELYEDIEPTLLERIEDVLFDRRDDATERLVEIAEEVRGEGKKRVVDEAWREKPLAERLAHALVHGVLDHLEEDLDLAVEAYDKPLHIIEGPLMDGMSHVGDLFGSGKMFLPQVVKSARAMKKAVAHLLPLLEAEKADGVGSKRGKILLATVKGDVHDIGKNIVGVVLGCNNYEIIDLGVMVPAERILDAAIEHDVDILGLSGLITPSLDEMIHVAREMKRREIDIPLLIGGATTSKQHTAIKLAPEAEFPILHVLDASRAVGVVSSLLSAEQKEAFLSAAAVEQERLREVYGRRAAKPLVPVDAARANRLRIDWSSYTPPEPAIAGLQTEEDVALEEIVPYIDWTFFFSAWGIKGRYPALLDDPRHGEAARELLENGRELLDQIVREKLLRAHIAWGLWPAHADGDDLVLFDPSDSATEIARFPMLRQQEAKLDDVKPHRSLADFVAPKETGLRDWLGAFAVNAGEGVDELVASYEADNDDYSALLVKALADRLAEALTEKLHRDVRRVWGYGTDENLDTTDLIAEKYRGIRPAFGYPACPDHSEKATLWKLLDAENTAKLRLTESFAAVPTAAVSGLYFSHPAARYFAVGKVGRDQVTDYARRKGFDVDEAERWLRPNLADEAPSGG